MFAFWVLWAESKRKEIGSGGLLFFSVFFFFSVNGVETWADFTFYFFFNPFKC